jgi:hypothetical protein
MPGFCHKCGTQFYTDSYIVKCDECQSNNISFEFNEADPDDIYQIGFIVYTHGDGLSWTEFCGKRTIIYSLRKNYSIIPSYCYDIVNGIILDPVNETFITFGLEE